MPSAPWLTPLAAACLLGACTAAPPPSRPTPPAGTVAPAPTPVSPATIAPLLVDPRCAVFLDVADLATALGAEVVAVGFTDPRLLPPPLIEIACTWQLADGTVVRLDVDDAFRGAEPALVARMQRESGDPVPLPGLGDLAFAYTDSHGEPAVAWAVRHGGADRTVCLHAGIRPAAQLLALAGAVHGDASPDLWTVPLPTPTPAIARATTGTSGRSAVG